MTTRSPWTILVALVFLPVAVSAGEGRKAWTPEDLWKRKSWIS